jgi:hypothetical protein
MLLANIVIRDIPKVDAHYCRKTLMGHQRFESFGAAILPFCVFPETPARRSSILLRFRPGRTRHPIPKRILLRPFARDREHSRLHAAGEGAPEGVGARGGARPAGEQFLAREWGGAALEELLQGAQEGRVRRRAALRQ